MSVVVEFSLAAEDFVLGSALASDGDVEVALEAVVPLGGERAPFLWVTGGDLEAFERDARAAEDVSDITRLDRVGDDVLYRVDWSPDACDLFAGLIDHEAVVLEAKRLRRWSFRVRFHDHDLLRQFYAFCLDNDIDLTVTRVAVLEEASELGPSLDLTPEQREALLLAVREGHFEVPGRTDLSAIAAELGISQQATSNRIRRGVDRVLRATLLGPGNRDRGRSRP